MAAILTVQGGIIMQNRQIDGHGLYLSLLAGLAVLCLAAALVWFARVLPWEFPDFSAAQCADRLFRAEEILQEQGFLSGTIHRYFLAAEKREK